VDSIWVEPLRNAADAVARQWNVLLFILGLMGISAAAEESGAFAWMANFVLYHARGSRRRLFVLLYAAATAVTVLLSNDATAIALTPIVYRAVGDRRDGDAKPFLFACIFVANAASFGLPFSNPANVLILPRPHLIAYLAHLGPPQVAVIVAVLALLLLFYRDRLKGSFVPVPSESPDRRTLWVLVALAAVIVAYVVALALEWPLGPVAIFGTALTLAVSRVKPLRAAARISWTTLALLIALFVLVDALARTGVAGMALAELGRALRYGNLATDVVAAGAAALLSNALNNLPVAVAASFVVAHMQAQRIAYPLIVGVDAGPNLITTGSLATILWLATLRERGVRVSLLEYLRLGTLLVPVTIAICVIWLEAVHS
jgi:arsenical pump membrane protein